MYIWKPNDANAKHDRIHTQALGESGPQMDGDVNVTNQSSRALEPTTSTRIAWREEEWCWGPPDHAQHVKERAEENTWISTWTGAQLEGLA